MQNWWIGCNEPGLCPNRLRGEVATVGCSGEGVYPMVAWHSRHGRNFLDMNVVAMVHETQKTGFEFHNPKERRWVNNTLSPAYQYRALNDGCQEPFLIS